MPCVSDIVAVRQLVSIMMAQGLSRFVLCPGSRNSPIVNMVSALPEMECRAATDERSAGFMALGWIQQCGSAVAVVVTSGSALLNLHPAVAEGYYQALPLLVISADRPAAWIAQQDGQTLPQMGAFGSLVRYAASLPEGDGREDTWMRNRLINEAVLALFHHGSGPVHLNVPLREPLFRTEPFDGACQHVRIIKRIEFACMGGDEEDFLIGQVRKSTRRMILVGQHALSLPLTDALQSKGFVIVAEHLGNAAAIEGCIRHADAVLGREVPADFAPDLLITVGGCIVSKRVKRLLREHPPKEHWHLSRDGSVVDTFRCLTLCLEGMQEELWELLEVFADEMQPDSEQEAFYQRWQKGAGNVLESSSLPYGGPFLVGSLLESLQPPYCLHLANSSAVRFAHLFPLPAGVEVLCNRGVNGIEGSLSTALGFACGDDRLNVLIIGDLSFFYDMNALGLPCLGDNIRILLLNNNCGGIFEMLPGIKQHVMSDRFVLARHELTAQAWAESCGLRYCAVREMEDWDAAIPLLVDGATGPLLVEAFVDASSDAQCIHEILNH